MVFTQTTLQSESLKKEKSHVVDYHRNSNHPVAARLFRPEHQLKLPANRRLDPYPARDCPHPHRFEAVGDRELLDPRCVIASFHEPVLLPSLLVKTKCPLPGRGGRPNNEQAYSNRITRLPQS
jgi:hypothetical protein